MTAQAAAPPAASAAATAAPAGDRGRVWRRRLGYAVLIGYALLMFVPFAWTVITSFKTLADSTRLTILPQPFTTGGWEYTLTHLTPPVYTLFANSLLIAGIVTFTNVVLASLAVYAFSRLRFLPREAIFL